MKRPEYITSPIWDELMKDIPEDVTMEVRFLMSRVYQKRKYPRFKRLILK